MRTALSVGSPAHESVYQHVVLTPFTPPPTHRLISEGERGYCHSPFLFSFRKAFALQAAIPSCWSSPRCFIPLVFTYIVPSNQLPLPPSPPQLLYSAACFLPLLGLGPSTHFIVIPSSLASPLLHCLSHVNARSHARRAPSLNPQPRAPCGASLHPPSCHARSHDAN